MTGMSRWWSGGTGDRMARTENKAVRLALALGAVKSVIRVIDRTVPPLTVDWASEAEDDAGKMRSMSYTDMRGGSIHVNPLPITSGALSHDAALDVCVGFGMHEASHSQESRDRFEALLTRHPITGRKEIEQAQKNPSTFFDRKTGQPLGPEVPAFRPMRIASYLWNVVEDVRIEQVTSSHWPGFEPYFGAVLDYMWQDVLDHGLPEAYGPEISDKLRIVFLACRYPDRAATLPDPIIASEVEWWKGWQADYLSGRADVKATIQSALDHLGEDPATKKQLDEMAAQEKAEQERGEKIRAQLERLMREGVEGAYGVCITHDGEVVPLDAETADEVNKLIREELVEHQTVIRTVGGRSPPIHVRKPEETAESRRAYVGKPNADSARLRTALVFRNSAPQYDLKLLKSGQIDDEELHRWGMGDYRVFSERIIEAKPDVFMGLLVDLSGSMSGQKLRIAQNLAQLFVWAVHDQGGIETRVWGHTGDLDEDNASEVFRLWEKGDPLSRLGLIQTLEHSNNYDGHAIGHVAKQMQDEEAPQKILIVLSDGLPSGGGYGGQPAANHVRATCRWAESRGVKVFQIAIDPYGVRPEDQAAMFGESNWIGFKDVASLPRQLTSLMSRYL